MLCIWNFKFGCSGKIQSTCGHRLFFNDSGSFSRESGLMAVDPNVWMLKKNYKSEVLAVSVKKKTPGECSIDICIIFDRNQFSLMCLTIETKPSFHTVTWLHLKYFEALLPFIVVVIIWRIKRF